MHFIQSFYVNFWKFKINKTNWRLLNNLLLLIVAAKNYKFIGGDDSSNKII